MNSTDAQQLMNQHLTKPSTAQTSITTSPDDDEEMDMSDYSDYSGSSNEDSNEAGYDDRVGTPGSYDAELGTTIQSDGIRRVKHASVGWRVTLPVMVETKYCGCYSWLVGLILLPCFGGFVCCCPIDKHTKPKVYEGPESKTCCDSFWDFCMPSRVREEKENLEYRREKKWVRVEQVTERETEMDLDQKMTDDRAEATNLVLSVLTKHAMVPQEALQCCHGDPNSHSRQNIRPESGISRISRRTGKSRPLSGMSGRSHPSRPLSGRSRKTGYLTDDVSNDNYPQDDDREDREDRENINNDQEEEEEEEEQQWYEDEEENDEYDENNYYDDYPNEQDDHYDENYCQYIWCQVKLERLSLQELIECVLRHQLMEDEENQHLQENVISFGHSYNIHNNNKMINPQDDFSDSSSLSSWRKEEIENDKRKLYVLFSKKK